MAGCPKAWPTGAGHRPYAGGVSEASQTVADPQGSPPPDSVLDNPAWESLRGHHASLARVRGRVARFDPEVSAFAGIAPDAVPETAWPDLAALLGPKSGVFLTGRLGDPPSDWDVLLRGEGVQLVDAGVEGRPEPEAEVLGPDDVPEIMDLVARTEPGPFLSRTIELGTYLGIRREGRLVAMAGERFRPPGWTEVSGVCTDPAYRGQGLADRLIRAVVHGIRERGERPFLHAWAGNVAALRLYESMGFTLRTRPVFLATRTPG